MAYRTDPLFRIIIRPQIRHGISTWLVKVSVVAKSINEPDYYTQDIIMRHYSWRKLWWPYYGRYTCKYCWTLGGSMRYAKRVRRQATTFYSKQLACYHRAKVAERLIGGDNNES
jgi:hypothetical protein